MEKEGSERKEGTFYQKGMPLGDATHLAGPLGGEVGCESCLVDGSVLAILIVTGAAEMSAGLCLGGFRFVFFFFFLLKAS